MDYQKLRNTRKKAGISQATLAAAVGINRATISKYESGTIEPPISQIKQIANVLGISWFELYANEQQGSIVAADVFKRAGLTVTDAEGNIIVQGDGRPWKKLSLDEARQTGILKTEFHSDEDRIAYYYERLNTDGKLVACHCFYQHLNPDDLTEVADYVEKLSETPQYQRPVMKPTEAPQDAPEDK